MEAKCCFVAAAEPVALVVTVSVTGTLLVEELNVTLEGLKLQLLSGGKPRQIEGDSAKLSVRPFWGANVSVVEPDCPGLGMLIVVGLAATVNVPPTSIRMPGDVEPLKLPSPLYCAVIVPSPSGIWVVLKPAPGGETLESTGTGGPRAVPFK